MTTRGTSLYKVPELWFEDGNIIMISKDKAFRVYQGIIASRSPVLRDMFNTPHFSSPRSAVVSPNVETVSKPLPATPHNRSIQDGADRIVIDGAQQVYSSFGVTGCPIVRVTDKPKDVKWFLIAFLGNSQQYSSNLAALAGILRLATKYRVDFLQRWAVSCLERLLPTDESRLIEDMQKKRCSKCMNGLLSLIDVAITGDMLWILSNVYWRLWQASLVEILNHPEWRELSEERRIAFLLGREAAQAVVVSEFALALRVKRAIQEAASPHVTTDCVHQFRNISIGILIQDGPHSGHDNTGDNASLWKTYRDKSACSLCKKAHEAQRRKMIVEAFAAVQKHFGLPDAKKLDEMRIKYHQEVHA